MQLVTNYVWAQRRTLRTRPTHSIKETALYSNYIYTSICTNFAAVFHLKTEYVLYAKQASSGYSKYSINYLPLV